jgi:predicted transposase YbfD/YdcC
MKNIALEVQWDQAGYVFDVGSLYEHLEEIKDQREPRGVRYSLVTILLLIVIAKLAGENTIRAIADWVKLRAEMMSRALGLTTESMPHPTTYSRVLGKKVKVEDLQEAISKYFAQSKEDRQEVIINLDGKTMRGTIRANNRGVHLLAAYHPGSGIVLAQVEVGKKENEIVAAPKILSCIDLQGKLVTGDAMFAQRSLSAQIVEEGGDYLFTIKDNQPTLRQDIETLFAHPPIGADFTKAFSIDKGHGRIESRTITSSAMLKGYSDWPYLEQVFKIERVVDHLSTGKRTQEISYGITSLPPTQTLAQALLEAVRKHWGIENGLHYRRDVTLLEDQCRVRFGHCAQSLATINNLVLGLILRQGITNVPDARRRYNAFPHQAINLVLQS